MLFGGLEVMYLLIEEVWMERRALVYVEGSREPSGDNKWATWPRKEV